MEYVQYANSVNVFKNKSNKYLWMESLNMSETLLDSR